MLISMLAACEGNEGLPDAGPHDRTLACGEGLVPIAARRAMPFRVDFEDLALDCREASLGRWSLRSDGSWFNVALKGDPPASALTMVPGVGSGTALAFHLGPTTPRPHAMDKLMVELYGRLGGGAESMIPFDEERFIAFRILLPPSFERPGRDDTLIVWQLWQGSPYGPPLRMEIDSEARPVFFLLNDETGSHPCAANPRCTPPPPYAGVIELYRGRPLTPDKWHHVVVGVLPRYLGMGVGEVRIWLDEPDPNRPSYAGRVSLGYDPREYASYPDAALRELGHPNEALEVAFGIYRTPQNAIQTIAFDGARLESALAEVGISRPTP